MPEISRFFGIVIKMFFSDHAPPHFHAEYAEHEALVTIETLEVLRGELTRRALPGPGMGGCPPRRAASGLEPRQVRSDPRTHRATRIKGGHMSLVRIAGITALAGQRLRLGLTDGTTIEREVGPLLNGPVFQEIRQKPELFAQVRAEGGTVVWPNGADLCPDVLIWGGAPPADATARPLRELHVTQ